MPPFSLEKFHPRFWTSRFYYGTALILLVLNLFGPKGFVQWVLISQEAARLEKKEADLKIQTERVRAQIVEFNHSDVAKARAIREKLGLMRAGEISVELLQSDPDAR